jgi:ATP-dependent DNA helicase RecQ
MNLNVHSPTTAYVPQETELEQARIVLHKIFGYSDFRGRQEEVIEHVLGGKNAVVLMPTGGGKSLCYQIPALVRNGVGIVVSPLIALMKDQVDALKQAGVRAAYLNSSLPPGEAREIEEGLRRNEFELVYVAPERVMMDSFQNLLSRIEVALFAIDEAHCVSQWGHNFRPEYAELSILHKRFPRVPMIALTATADNATRKDIFDRLGLSDAKMFVSGFDRPNINYRIIDKNSPKNQLLAFIKSEYSNDSGIVYCQSRNKVEEIATWLSSEGITAVPYHAGLDQRIRERHHTRFIQEENVVVVATIAFGMGINKPNVRFVAHLDLPRTLEAYYQETGRAGRDGLPATAWMTYGLSDVVETKYRILTSELDERQKRIEFQKFEALLGFCESYLCRRSVLLSYFGEAREGSCSNCDLCTTPIKTWDGTTAAQKALSAVYRTGQQFGVGYLIDVLLGKKTERITQYKHDQIKTFGVGSDLQKGDWHAIFRQLVAAGYLSVDLEGHGGLRLAKRAEPLLKGEEKIMFRELLKIKESKKGTKGSKATKSDGLLDEQHVLWQLLRDRRLSLSREQGVPPYIIFHDTTLLEMIYRRPQSLLEMSKLPGVGDSKLQKYGQIFLDVLAEADSVG